LQTDVFGLHGQAKAFALIPRPRTTLMLLQKLHDVILPELVILHTQRKGKGKGKGKVVPVLNKLSVIP
jgi:hypothetical protein